MEAAGRRVRFRTGPRFLPFFILTWAAAPALWPGEPVSTGEKVAWFADNAVTLRSINPKDRDYSDLRPIQQAIGSARVVLLGGSNDEGIAKARYRLVRFLHEEMGFDVLTSDMPLFDATEFDRPLDEGKTPRPDLEELIAGTFWYSTYPHWSYNRTDILDYVKDTHKTEHPLHIAGFGWWVSAYMETDYTHRLFQFLDRAAPHLASPADRKAIQSLVTLSGPRRWAGGGFRPRVPVEPQRWQKTLPPGLAAITKLYDGLGRLSLDGPNLRETAFYRQTLASLAYYAAGVAHRPLAGAPVDSVVMLAKIWRPASKIIVWSGNWVVARNIPVPEGPKGRPRPTVRSPGNELARVFGSGAYAIAFSEIKNDNGVLEVLQAGPQPKLAPVDGDLESLLHATGKPYSFVDFRTLPADHWLRTPLSARLVNGSDVSVWPDHFDGLITIDVPVAKERK